MNNVAVSIVRPETDWMKAAQQVGELLAEAAADHDRDGQFVAGNYEAMKQSRLFSAAIPRELGGGGASYPEVCAIVRELGSHCASTGLSYAMHSHPVAVNVYKYRRDDQAAKTALGKIAAGELVVSGTGANDWLVSNGTAVAVEGGFRVTAHKRFCSGGPGADLFVTSAVYTGDRGDEVLHFAVPMNSEGIEIQSNWDTLGMRGTGSNDILMKEVFVPTAAVVARRPAGEWHPMWDVIVPIALPVIVSVYVGLASAAADHALRSAHGKAGQAGAIGQLQNELTTAELALADMIRRVDDYSFDPCLETTSAILARKTIAARAVRNAVEIASEIVGGSGFFRGHPVERMVRDVRAFHFHPMPERRQCEFSGRIALRMDPIG